jgi:hypothetical protein
VIASGPPPNPGYGVNQEIKQITAADFIAGISAWGGFVSELMLRVVLKGT